ncbi:MAG: hypothetical protein ACRDI2_14475, partial [Chloroflexota bacterium]
ANLLGSGVLVARIERRLEPGAERLMPSVIRIVVGSAALAGTAALAVVVLSGDDPGRARATIGLAAACLTGAAVFALTQRVMRTSELSWVMGGIRGLARPARSTFGGQP